MVFSAFMGVSHIYSLPAHGVLCLHGIVPHL
jgi:hypothetical protein